MLPRYLCMENLVTVFTHVLAIAVAALLPAAGLAVIAATIYQAVAVKPSRISRRQQTVGPVSHRTAQVGHGTPINF